MCYSSSCLASQLGIRANVVELCVEFRCYLFLLIDSPPRFTHAESPVAFLRPRRRLNLRSFDSFERSGRDRFLVSSQFLFVNWFIPIDSNHQIAIIILWFQFFPPPQSSWTSCSIDLVNPSRFQFVDPSRFRFAYPSWFCTISVCESYVRSFTRAISARDLLFPRARNPREESKLWTRGLCFSQRTRRIQASDARIIVKMTGVTLFSNARVTRHSNRPSEARDFSSWRM